MAKRAMREGVEKNGQYWKSRFKAMEDDQYRKSAAYYKDVQEQFRRAQNDIQMDIEHWYQRMADNNDISLAGAKRLLKAGELDEFKWNVEQYIKAGEENALDQRWMKQLENASARQHISRLEAMKLQIRQHAEVLFTGYEGGMANFLNQSYADQFYHSAFEIAKGTGVGSNLARIDNRRIDTVIRRPWAQDGANFSERIWSNKEKLVNTLHTELTQQIIRGSDPRKAIDSLSKTMEVSKTQAGRLIMTESAAIASAATQDCFKELGVDQYEILAALDSRTCDICQELDGEVFTMKEYEVGMTAPPFHPNCRCTTIPYFDDEFSAVEQRAARDPETGKTVYVPADMKYQEWEERYVSKDTLEDSISDRIKKGAKGILTGETILNYNELPETVRGDFEAGLEHADKQVSGLLRCEMDDTQYFITDSRNSEYTEHINVVGINPKKGSGSIAHEIFHRIDDKYKVTKNSNMLNNFIADFQGNRELFDDPLKYLQSNYPAIFEDSTFGTQKVLKAKYQGLSDIFSALSNGKIKLGYGHAAKYWTQHPERRIKEIWAQYGRIYYENDAEVKELLSSLFPSGTKRVNMKLKGLMKDVEG